MACTHNVYKWFLKSFRRWKHKANFPHRQICLCHVYFEIYFLFQVLWYLITETLIAYVSRSFTNPKLNIIFRRYRLQQQIYIFIYYIHIYTRMEILNYTKSQTGSSFLDYCVHSLAISITELIILFLFKRISVCEFIFWLIRWRYIPIILT